jgi:hypothetical protein
MEIEGDLLVRRLLRIKAGAAHCIPGRVPALKEQGECKENGSIEVPCTVLTECGIFCWLGRGLRGRALTEIA